MAADPRRTQKVTPSGKQGSICDGLFYRSVWFRQQVSRCWVKHYSGQRVGEVSMRIFLDKITIWVNRLSNMAGPQPTITDWIQCKAEIQGERRNEICNYWIPTMYSKILYTLPCLILTVRRYINIDITASNFHIRKIKGLSNLPKNHKDEISLHVYLIPKCRQKCKRLSVYFRGRH